MASVISGPTALAFVLVRLFVALMQHSFGLDDAFCMAAGATRLAMIIVEVLTARAGFGRDTWTVSAENIYLALKVVCRSLGVVLLNLIAN